MMMNVVFDGSLQGTKGRCFLIGEALYGMKLAGSAKLRHKVGLKATGWWQLATGNVHTADGQGVFI